MTKNNFDLEKIKNNGEKILKLPWAFFTVFSKSGHCVELNISQMTVIVPFLIFLPMDESAFL